MPGKRPRTTLRSPRERAAELRKQGWGPTAIAAELGVSKMTIVRWNNPAYEERTRQLTLASKRRRSGTCVDCGAATRYGGKTPSGVSKRCPDCAHRAARTVDRDEIVSLRLEGLTQQAIADRLGCTQSHVSFVLVSAGLGVGKGRGPGRGPKLEVAA